MFLNPSNPLPLKLIAGALLALAVTALEAWLRGKGYAIPLITPLLMIGGAFLCYEGVEKLAHKLLHSRIDDASHHAELVHAVSDESVDMLAFEQEKIKGAIRTDFILSAEIIVISLGTVATQPFMSQLAVLVAIALIMTVGVYGLVGAIVKLDDLGLRLTREGAGKASALLGRGILAFAPRLMKFLSVAGTAAMFLVGGGILVHGIPALHPSKAEAAERAGRLAMDLLRRDLRPSQIITREALENAAASIVATGGSTNGVLHLLAIARELGTALWLTIALSELGEDLTLAGDLDGAAELLAEAKKPPRARI